MRKRTGFPMGFTERLTQVIEEKQITTRQLCECTRKERKTIYAYKNGDTSPDAVTLARMCCLLGVSADWLLFGKDKGGTHEALCADNNRQAGASDRCCWIRKGAG